MFTQENKKSPVSLRILFINLLIEILDTILYNKVSFLVLMSKYEKEVVQLLEKNLKSTNEILGELENKTQKKINWYAIYHILSELEREGKAEKIKLKGGFYWRRK